MSVLFVGHPKETDLALFAGGELGLLARWRIEKHLQSCDHCRQAVADFFHLQSEVGELADLPAIEWETLTQRICERAAQEAPAPPERRPGWLAQPALLRAGLATATVICAVVVVNHFQFFKSAPQPQSPLVANQRLQTEQVVVSADTETVERDATEAEQAAASQFRAVSAPQRAKQKGPAEGQADRLRLAEAKEDLPGDVLAPAAPSRAEKTAAGPAASAGELREGVPRFAAPAMADRKNEARAGIGSSIQKGETDRQGQLVADAVTPARPVRRQPAPVREASGRRDGAERKASDPGSKVVSDTPQVASALGERGQMAATIAEVRVAERELGAELSRARPLREAGESARWAIRPAMAKDSQTDVGVRADGWISFRSLDTATGQITITHVYAP